MKSNWNESLKPLLKKYKAKKHPLNYNSIYELLVMVVLSAQSTDKLINEISPKLFADYPTMEALSQADVETLIPYITKVRNFRNKAKWLIGIANSIGSDKNIPVTMERLVKLSGIGRKSANVILREAKVKASGVIVDLHVLRVAPRIGIVSNASSEDALKMERELMNATKESNWGELGMALSFLGREICRPTDPDCKKCVIRTVCNYNLKNS